MSSVVEDINDKHMEPWADACQRDGILNTPLNPFIDQVWAGSLYLCVNFSGDFICAVNPALFVVTCLLLHLCVMFICVFAQDTCMCIMHWPSSSSILFLGKTGEAS